MKKLHLTMDRKNIIRNVAAVLIAMIFLFPLYWIIVNSFKLDGEIFRAVPTLWPENFTLTAYESQVGNLLLNMKNSIIIALGSMALSLTISIPAGYGLARFQIKGKKFFLLVFLVSQMLPASLMLTPMFLTYSKLDLLNTYWAPVLSTAASSIPFTILLLRPNFLHIPKELDESARMDGCNVLQAFLYIVLPSAKPTIVTALCFSFVMAWNDLAYSMTFNTASTMRPMTAAIYTLMNQYGLRWNSIMAYGVLLIMPTCILFVTMQKHIISGLVSGSVKG